MLCALNFIVYLQVKSCVVLYTLSAPCCFFCERSQKGICVGIFQRRKMADGTATCIDIILAIILPPLGVFLKFGCKVEFWICLLLTILGYLPGIIYAIWVITKT